MDNYKGDNMVTPQQREQVVVKSIGDIQRDTTVRSRRANPTSPPRPNLGHANVVPTMIQGIGILNRYAKALQHPAHTLGAGLFVANSTPVSLSKVRGINGKTGAVVKAVIYGHLALTFLATGYATYKGFKK